MPVRLDEVVSRFGGTLIGDGSVTVDGAASLLSERSGYLGFLSNSKYRSTLARTRAAAVVLTQDAVDDCPVAAIVTQQPYLYFARVMQWLYPVDRPAFGVHPSAIVESTISDDVAIGPNVFIGADVTIGAGTVIGANCSIGNGSHIGAEGKINANVAIYQNCRIGARSIIHAGAVIGADGFGFARDGDGSWVKFPQIGGVVIGDDVEIGAGTTIDRGALDNTVIEDGVKLDNQIQIAHNVHIGAHSALAGCVGIAGSARIGRRCTSGGGAIILGHIELADEVHVSAGTLVSKSILQRGSYTGTVPFMPHDAWLKNFSRLRHLDALADKIRTLEARLAALEQGKTS